MCFYYQSKKISEQPCSNEVYSTVGRNTDTFPNRMKKIDSDLGICKNRIKFFLLRTKLISMETVGTHLTGPGRTCVWIQIVMFRSIRVDHTNCLQVTIKTHSFSTSPMIKVVSVCLLTTFLGIQCLILLLHVL
jgi:hypothetical protein